MSKHTHPNPQIADGYDFNTFSQLAKDDPEEFEKEKQKMISNLISSRPVRYQQSLLCFQLKADELCDKHKGNPLECAKNMHQLMFTGGYNRLHYAVNNTNELLTPPPPVLTFKKK